MTVFIDPDELSSSSKFPTSISTIPCLGLEARTGADFVICTLPINPLDNMQWHLDNDSSFVQRKSGNDVINFHNLKRSIARMKALKIPQGRCILLPIGIFGVGLNEKITINGDALPFESNVTYQGLRITWAMWLERGGVVEPPLLDESHIEDWIEAKLRALEKVKEQSSKQIYSEESVFQAIEEIPKDDLRSLLCRGLPNFGPKMAENTVAFLKKSKMPLTLLSAYDVLTSVGSDKRPIHKIPGWGKKSFENLRELFGFCDGANLATSISFQSDVQFSLDNYHRGWMNAIDQMVDIAKKRKEKGENITFFQMLELAKKHATEFLIEE